MFVYVCKCASLCIQFVYLCVCPCVHVCVCVCCIQEKHECLKGQYICLRFVFVNNSTDIRHEKETRFSLIEFKIQI